VFVADVDQCPPFFDFDGLGATGLALYEFYLGHDRVSLAKILAKTKVFTVQRDSL
jgi:hypothetical protein